jgi:hypothetical protein
MSPVLLDLMSQHRPSLPAPSDQGYRLQTSILIPVRLRLPAMIFRNQDVTGTHWFDEPSSPFSPRSIRSRLPATGFYLCSRQLKVASDRLLFSFTSTQGWQRWDIISVLVTLPVTADGLLFVHFVTSKLLVTWPLVPPTVASSDFQKKSIFCNNTF